MSASLEQAFADYKSSGLNLDLTRGKPGQEQLDLSDNIDGILNGNYLAADGTDVRNYGGLDGLPETKALFAQVLDASPAQTLIGGNSSLTLMYQSIMFLQWFAAKPWSENPETTFLCPSPGYDRHFTVCESLGIKMIPVAMTEHGPDMDQVEALVQADSNIKGIWCVPRFSNPTGIVYNDETVDRLAKLGQIAGEGFTVMWDNAYAIHSLHEQAPQLANILSLAATYNCEENILAFGSTSKVTFAGAGVAFMAAGPQFLKGFKAYLGNSSIGPDKVNQLRHVRFFKDTDGLNLHMKKHAALLKPRFDIVLNKLEQAFGDDQDVRWTVPEGGYFVAVDVAPGTAKAVISLAAEAGVKLTPAGATFPYGNDPKDENIRLAPSFPSLEDIEAAMDVFCCCVKLAKARA